MKAKTFLELASLSTALYTISKDAKLMEKLEALSETGKEKINHFMKDVVIDENGKEMEFLDRLALKAQETKDDLETKIGEMATAFYAKINVAHTDKILLLQNKLDQLQKDVSLVEARINQLEKTQNS
jgi:polyhydroxyalkanoate synthesis regulator phasin